VPANVSLLTRHHKGIAIAPALLRAGLVVVEVDSFDTDTLGTFSGEVERQGTMRDAALTKARRACELGGTRYGLGSEGAFGADPFLGVAGWGRELLVWWDAELGYAVEGFAQGPETNWRSLEVGDVESALRFARAIGFPAHGILVGQPGEARFDKPRDEACDSESALAQRVCEALTTGPVMLQTDMRAHRNPTRMAMIARTAGTLAERLMATCPSCAAPGWGPVEAIPGAPCEACGAPTLLPRARRWSCPLCGQTDEHPLSQQAPAERCDHCNP